MTRNIEIIMAATGAGVGLAVAGVNGALGGAVAGGIVGVAGVNSLRRSNGGMSIYINQRTRKDMESAMHIAMASTWALRPLIEVDLSLQREIAQRVFDVMVESYTVEVTPFIQEMNLHLFRVVHSGIKPDASLEHVRRKYAPRFLRKDDSISFMIARHILDIQAQYGPIAECEDWFMRWCDAVGLGKNARGLWVDRFGNERGDSMDEWKAQRRKAAQDSYFEDCQCADESP